MKERRGYHLFVIFPHCHLRQPFHILNKKRIVIITMNMMKINIYIWLSKIVFSMSTKLGFWRMWRNYSIVDGMRFGSWFASLKNWRNGIYIVKYSIFLLIQIQEIQTHFSLNISETGMVFSEQLSVQISFVNTWNLSHYTWKPLCWMYIGHSSTILTYVQKLKYDKRVYHVSGIVLG